MSNEDKGSYGAGFLLGFCLGIFGLIIAVATGKEDTKRGSYAGFGFSMAITIILLICGFCSINNWGAGTGGYYR